jgi:hypothetical protein
MLRVTGTAGWGLLGALAAMAVAAAVEAQSVPAYAEEGDSADQFGSSVLIDGSRIVVGPFANVRDHVYLYELGSTGWNRTAQFRQRSQMLTGDRGARPIALSGDYIAIGYYLTDVLGVARAGEVAVSERSPGGWSAVTTLTSPAAYVDERFGGSVAFDGNLLLIGAPSLNNVDPGRAYIYERTGPAAWTLRASLTPSDGVANDRFGWGVWWANGRALVFALNHRPNTSAPRGAIYVFAQNGAQWQQVQKVQVGTSALDVAQDLMVGVTTAGQVQAWQETGGQWTGPQTIGAFTPAAPPNDLALHRGATDRIVISQGAAASVWVAERSAGGNWSTPTSVDVLGAAAGLSVNVSTSGDRFVVGNPGLTVNRLSQVGETRVFRYSGAAALPESTLRNTAGFLGDRAGSVIAGSGDYVLVAADGTDVAAGGTTRRDVGTVFVYQRTPSLWARVAELSPSDQIALMNFGLFADLRGNLAVVGSRASLDGLVRGRLHVFRRDGLQWNRICEIEPPAPGATEFFDVRTDGSFIVARSFTTANRFDAWQVDPSGSCVAAGEAISIPTPLGPSLGQAYDIADGLLALVDNRSNAVDQIRLLRYQAGVWQQQSVITDLAPTLPADASPFAIRMRDAATVAVQLSLATATGSSVPLQVHSETGGTWTRLVSISEVDRSWSRVAWAGNTLVASDIDLRQGIDSSGRARVFEAPSYLQTAVLTASGLTYGEGNCFAVGAANDAIFIGCPQQNGPNGRRSGGIHQFIRAPGRGAGASWTPVGLLQVPPGNDILQDGFEPVP